MTAQPESGAARTTGELADVGAGHHARGVLRHRGFRGKMKGLHPGPGSTLFRVVDFPPISPDFQKDNPRFFIELEGLQEIAAKSRPPRHAFHIGAWWK